MRSPVSEAGLSASPQPTGSFNLSTREGLMQAIKIGRDRSVERPFDIAQVAESIGEIVDLTGEQYLARESKLPAIPDFRGWKKLDENTNGQYPKGESLNMALYQKDDATVAVILGIDGKPSELIREGRFVKFGGKIPESYQAAFDTLDKWRERHPDLIVSGHSKGGTIADIYAAQHDTPTITLEDFPTKPVIEAFKKAGKLERSKATQVLSIHAAFRPWSNGETSRQDDISVSRPIDMSRANNGFHAHDMRMVREQFNHMRIQNGTAKPDAVGPAMAVPEQSAMMRFVNTLPSATKLKERAFGP